MNAGQIIMSMMQEITKSVTPDAALMAGGGQKQADGGFADLLCTLQAKAGQFPNASQVQSEVSVTESEPVDVSVEDFIADGVQNNMEVNTAEVQMLLAAYAQTAVMPIVNNQPGHEVDAVQNVPDAAAEQQQSQPAPAIVETAAKVVEVPVQPQPTTVLTSATGPKPELEQEAELIPTIQLKTEGAAVANQSTPSQQIGRMPIVNTPFSHDVDAVQNVPVAPKADQPSAALAAPLKDQAVEPVQLASQTLAEQKASSASDQQPTRQSAAVINAMSDREFFRPAAESLTSPAVRPAQPLLQTTLTAAQSLEEITFSLPQPTTVSKARPLESNRMSQEGTLSVQHQEVGRTPTAVMPANPEDGLTRKQRSDVVMSGTATGTPLLQSETNNLAKRAVDISSASLRQEVRSVPAQHVPDELSENGRPSSNLSVTKENVVSQQNMVPAGEAALTSDDSMSNSGDQAWPDQTSDNQMSNPQVHVQSKSELQAVGHVSNPKFDVEQSRQDLPEQIVRQVRERLAQHEVKPGNQHITLTLSPENMGELKMNLNLQGQRLSVEIVTENRAARDAILQHSDSLKESLARQNISVESFDVTANGRGAGNPGHNQDAWKELARQKQQQFWTSAGGYRPSQVEGATNPLAYLAKNEHAMLDIHY